MPWGPKQFHKSKTISTITKSRDGVVEIESLVVPKARRNVTKMVRRPLHLWLANNSRIHSPTRPVLAKNRHCRLQKSRHHCCTPPLHRPVYRRHCPHSHRMSKLMSSSWRSTRIWLDNCSSSSSSSHNNNKAMFRSIKMDRVKCTLLGVFRRILITRYRDQARLHQILRISGPKFSSTLYISSISNTKDIS